MQETHQQQTHGDWPTLEAQAAYWRERDNVMLCAFESIHKTVKSLSEAVRGLHQICQHQQEQIDKLNALNK